MTLQITNRAVTDYILVLETIIPGYAAFSRVMLDYIGFDVTLVVSIALVTFALTKSIGFMKQKLREILVEYFTCSVLMDNHIDTYYHMMGWLAERDPNNRASILRALAPDYTKFHRGVDGQVQHSAQPYETAIGLPDYFWHKGHLFLWQRRTLERVSGITIEGQLSCLSWTTAPIKAVIEESRNLYENKISFMTRVKRPAQGQGQGPRGYWTTVATRPLRPMHTVIVDQKLKDALLEDMRQYCRPENRKYYSDREIPYRRGYVSDIYFSWRVTLASYAAWILDIYEKVQAAYFESL